MIKDLRQMSKCTFHQKYTIKEDAENCWICCTHLKRKEVMRKGEKSNDLLTGLKASTNVRNLLSNVRPYNHFDSSY